MNFITGSRMITAAGRIKADTKPNYLLKPDKKRLYQRWLMIKAWL